MAEGARFRLLRSSPSLEFALTALFGLLLRDTVLKRDEVDGVEGGVVDFRLRGNRHD